MADTRFVFPTIKSSAHSLQSAAWWTMFACSAVALTTSGYLAWASLTSSPVAGCGSGSVFDCSHVLHSRWSSVLSIPVSIPAIAMHFVMLTMLIANPISQRSQQVRWRIAGFVALSAGLAAVWFIGLQVFWLEHLCSYCLVAHSGGILLATVFLMTHPIEKGDLKWVAAAAVVAVGGLIGLQSMNSDPKTYELISHPEVLDENGSPVIEEEFMFEPPKPLVDPQAWLNSKEMRSIILQLSNALAFVAQPTQLLTLQVDDGAPAKPASKSALILNNLRLETTSWPLLGKPDAELVFVEMFDYTCEHCQRTHKGLEGARQKLGDKLSIIALPVPMDGKCNPAIKVTDANHVEACALAKLAIAVWSVDREKFSDFHHFLFTVKPKYKQALEKAEVMVEPAKLKLTLDSKLPDDYITKHVALYQKAGAGTIPKLMFPKTTSIGALESAEVIVQLIEQHLR